MSLGRKTNSMMMCKEIRGIKGVRTDLAGDDRRVDDEEDEFVQKLVQEAHTGIQQC